MWMFPLMRVADFSFDLPDELIARFPKQDRTSSRLLTLDGPSGDLEHKIFSDVLDLVNENDLLVFNNTKVIPARMYGQKSSGGKVEVLVERVLDEHRVLGVFGCFGDSLDRHFAVLYSP